MKLQFKNQQFQSDAAKAVTDVFQGQPNGTMLEYTHDTGVATSGQADMDFGTAVGFRNAPLRIDSTQLTENIRRIQMAQMLKPADHVMPKGLRLTIEMETGTGKTYTYIKTMLELNKHYGWSKFIVVVPSIAIREGVCKSFDIMSEHFAREYGKRIQSFVYDSSQLTKIDQFASDANMQVMIINTQAFNARGEDARRIYMKLDTFRSRKPIDVIAATNPILIIDEPQSVLGADKKNATRKRLEEFHPLFTLLYSATHRPDDIENMIYRLDAMDAYNKKLVKKITVKGIEQKGTTATNGYLFLEGIELSDGNPRAWLSFDKKTKTGVKTVTQVVTDGFDLYQNSGELQEYANGYRIESIDGYDHSIRLLNGLVLHEGDMVGNINERAIRTAQIRETIKSHIEKERKLFRMGIKCLSLFFIDHVDNYRLYGEGGTTSNGIYADIFEEQYDDIVHSMQTHLERDEKDYYEYLVKYEPKDVHNGYFSKDKKGHFQQPKVSELKSENGSNDVDAYDLIMRDKERLLSLDEPTRFIFSHSALKEGWDNPNVFQICTLKDSDNTTKKRQEVGRGMRLCVNRHGERQDESVLHGNVFDVNELTIVASESYDSFARELQTEIAENIGDRPKKVGTDLFTNMMVTNARGEERSLGHDDAQEIYVVLRTNGYIDKHGQLTPKYHDDKKNGQLDFGEEYNEYKADLVKKIDTVYDPTVVAPENGRGVREAKFDNKKFNRKEFQDLWKRINHKTYYTVDFDTEELIEKATKALDNELHVSAVTIHVVEGTMDKIASKEQLKAGEAMQVKEDGGQYKRVEESVASGVKYDLIGKLVESTQLTRKAIVDILKKISPRTFEQFKVNPEEFIIKAGNIINKCKAISVVEHIEYHKLDQQYTADVFAESTLKGKLGVNAMESHKSLYDMVVVDSKGVEMNFAKELEQENAVAIYTKLPGGFYINTPMGHYNPDWAVVFNEGDGVKHIYFVAETKGSIHADDRRNVENAKIECARKHFASISSNEVIYDVVTNYSDLQRLILG